MIRKYALQNAVFYNGKANPGAVLGKVLAENPNLRKNIAPLRSDIENTVESVNELSPEDQKKELEGIDKKLLVKEEKKQGLPELKDAKMGKVVTRFAPAPSGPLTIFHILRAASLSYIYAKRYKGKFILRLEDTDPSKVEKQFYGMIEEDLKSVSLKPDKVIIESNDMEKFYEQAEKLIRNRDTYVCSCSAEDFRKLKIEKKECDCRKRSDEPSLFLWNEMLEGKMEEGEAVLRLKTNMSDPNPAIRDPPLFRIAKGKHPLTGNKYYVWPLYNFANTVEDHLQGITHVFRGKEHEHNTAIQERVYKALGWKPPIVINFGMVYLPGEKLHTRDIKDGIKTGKYSGWDDPSLPTLRAFLRRGFQPEAFLEAAKGCGLSKTDIRLGWENIYAFNRKSVDPKADRYMAVIDPVKIKMETNKKQTELIYHPDFPKRGKRKVDVSKNIFISGEDFKCLKGKSIRLIELGNIKLDKTSQYNGDELIQSMQKIQWVSEPNVKIKILTPEGELSGLGEPAMAKLKVGDIIQMNRIGFARVDSKTKGQVVLVFGHK